MNKMTWQDAVKKGGESLDKTYELETECDKFVSESYKLKAEAEFTEGDIVSFKSVGHERVVGTITKINRASPFLRCRIKPLNNPRKVWSVPASMLKKESRQ